MKEYFFKGIQEGQNQNFVIREEEAELSHKGNQDGNYTQVTNAVVGEQSKEPIVTVDRVKLASEDSQKEDKED